MKSAGRKRNIPMYAAGVLLCLTMLSLYLVSGLYAKYSSMAEASDGARTAAFYLKAEGDFLQNTEVKIIPGDTEEKIIEIVNNSEVSLSYTLIIKNETENLPLTLELSDTSQNYIPNNGVFTVTADLAPGSRTDTYNLIISWPEDNASPDSNLAFAGMLDYITLSLKAKQID